MGGQVDDGDQKVVDPLDLPSGTEGPDGKELTFRQLGAYYAKHNRAWDDLKPSTRLAVEKSRDPKYRPLAAFEGTTRKRRRQVP